MASFDLREAYLQVPVHPPSRHFLRFLFRDTVYQFKALCFGLLRLRRSSPGSWLLFRLYSILWVSVCVDTSTTDCSSPPLRSLSSWFFRLSSDFVTNWGLSSIHESPTSSLPRWCSICGSSSLPPLSGLLRLWNASHGCDPQPPYFCHAPRLPLAYGCRF